jgi:hypothetical protein
MWRYQNNILVGKCALADVYCETAKANGLMPFDYLKYLLEQLAHKPTDLDYLLPWNVALART